MEPKDRKWRKQACSRQQICMEMFIQLNKMYNTAQSNKSPQIKNRSKQTQKRHQENQA